MASPAAPCATSTHRPHDTPVAYARPPVPTAAARSPSSARFVRRPATGRAYFRRMLRVMAEQPRGPDDVWDLIRRADDLVKYSPNRDPEKARAQARDQLKRAAQAAAMLADRNAGEALAQQVRTRLDDLERAERDER